MASKYIPTVFSLQEVNYVDDENIKPEPISSSSK